MRLLFIFGPPASGKMTVGREIMRRTGYSFFFNHVTVPAARAIFPKRHAPQYEEAYHDLLKDLRIAGIKAAVKSDLDTIFTLAYSGSVDDAFVRHIITIVTKKGGQVDFIQLQAPNETLYERVTDPNRTLLGKVDSQDRLKDLLSNRDLHASMPLDNVLKIDTTLSSPEESAATIIRAFGLDQVTPAHKN